MGNKATSWLQVLGLCLWGLLVLGVILQPAGALAASFAGDAQCEPSSAISFEAQVVPPCEENTVTIGRAGGTIPSQLNPVNVLVVYENALSADTPINMVRTLPENLPDYAMISCVFNMGPSETTFATPSTLTLPYDEINIPTEVSEDNLAIYRRASAGGSWERVGGTVDKAANTVTVQIGHLSEYAVMAQLPTQPIPVAIPLWVIVVAGIALVVAVITVIWMHLLRGGGG